MPGGKAHMPALHERIRNHIVKSGYPAKYAWGAAVNAVRKGCLTGDVNFPGKQSMNAVSRAEYCKAYREWKKNHPGGK